MNKKTCPILIIPAFLLLPVLLLAAFKVKAADTDTVTATVTAEVISVTLDQTNIPFGVLGQGDTMPTTILDGGTGPDYTITAENDGSVLADLQIQTSDTVDWDHADAAGSDLFTMEFCTWETYNCNTAPTWVATGSENIPDYEALSDDLAVSSTMLFDLRIGTPSSTAVVTQQSATVTVMAVSAN